CCSPFFFYRLSPHRALHSFPTRRSSDLPVVTRALAMLRRMRSLGALASSRSSQNDASCSCRITSAFGKTARPSSSTSPLEWSGRSEEHTSELQSLAYLVCRLLLEKKKKK